MHNLPDACRSLRETWGSQHPVVPDIDAFPKNPSYADTRESLDDEWFFSFNIAHLIKFGADHTQMAEANFCML